MGRRKMDTSHIRTMDQALYGNEPQWSKTPDDVDIALLKAYTFYNATADPKDCRKWTLDYAEHIGMSKHQLTLLKSLAVADFDREGFTARMIMLGAPMWPKRVAVLEATIKGLIELAEYRIKTASTAPAKKVAKVEDPFDAKLADLEAKLDGLLLPYAYKRIDFSLSDWLTSIKATRQQTGIVRTKLTEIRAEWKLAAEGVADYAEAYPYTTRQLQSVVDLLTAMIGDCDKTTENTTKTRKPRAKKAVPAAKLAADVQYKVEDPDLGIKSIKPADVIGSSLVLLFDTKYNYMRIVRPALGQTLTISGTTIKGMDPARSYGKTLRKPKETLPLLVKSISANVDKIMDGLTTKKQTTTGRINKDNLILRSF